MGTKNDPGPYDCYAKLGSDEPYFILRANDPTAVDVVQAWIAMNVQHQPNDKLGEAAVVMREMIVWKRDQREKEKADGPPVD